ncbi:hypothetical protein B0T14DRAFT_504639 [Immersiella caudata]|uniref:Uncharacterized protein n=1 Tax=Immersiella caudata TaxID=314043 RepID=A0AA40CBZ6_9PEZI|nr:hypothetical protein B0T14DRAFT_504639 [Immersiella caudata]
MDNQTLPRTDLAKRQAGTTDAELQVYIPSVEDPGGLIDLPHPVINPGSRTTSVSVPIPALTTRWTAPTFCSTLWTYYATNSSDRISWLLHQPGVTAENADCRPPGWYISQGTFSPAVCPYRWASVEVKIQQNDLTSIQCCPSGYSILAKDFSDGSAHTSFTKCISTFTTTALGVLVFKNRTQTYGELSDVSGALTYAVSPVHVLHAKTDLSILPAETPNDTAATPSPTDTAAGNTTSGAEAKLSSGAIAGIVIGTLLGSILVLAATFFVWKRRRAERAAKLGTEPEGRVEMPGYSAEPKTFEAEAKEKSPAVGSPVEMLADRGHSPHARNPVELP